MVQVKITGSIQNSRFFGTLEIFFTFSFLQKRLLGKFWLAEVKATVVDG